jgi:hypothetical protein
MPSGPQHATDTPGDGKPTSEATSGRPDRAVS